MHVIKPIHRLYYFDKIRLFKQLHTKKIEPLQTYIDVWVRYTNQHLQVSYLNNGRV